MTAIAWALLAVWTADLLWTLARAARAIYRNATQPTTGETP